MGSTYAEADLSNQMMYFVQNGQVVLAVRNRDRELNKGNGTPQGSLFLAYKALDQVLRGTKKPDGTYEYETPVKFWMPSMEESASTMLHGSHPSADPGIRPMALTDA